MYTDTHVHVLIVEIQQKYRTSIVPPTALNKHANITKSKVQRLKLRINKVADFRNVPTCRIGWSHVGEDLDLANAIDD